MLTNINNSSVYNPYSQQTVNFVDNLIAHLGQFNLSGMGITEAAMRNILAQPDAGHRINGLVRAVTEKPGNTPFRQLTLRLINGSQGRLADSEQHGLHNYFTRSEDFNVWSSNMDGVIGAVNRESFQYP